MLILSNTSSNTLPYYRESFDLTLILEIFLNTPLNKNDSCGSSIHAHTHTEKSESDRNTDVLTNVSKQMCSSRLTRGTRTCVEGRGQTHERRRQAHTRIHTTFEAALCLCNRGYPAHLFLIHCCHSFPQAKSSFQPPQKLMHI